jgi:tRNA 2-selenouridine synthase SelU
MNLMGCVNWYGLNNNEKTETSNVYRQKRKKIMSCIYARVLLQKYCYTPIPLV